MRDKVASGSCEGVDWESLRLFATDVDGTLTDGGMYYTAEGEAMKRFDTRDAFGMNRLRQRGITLAIVTSEDSRIVIARARKLRIKHVYVGVAYKEQLMDEMLSELGMTWAEVAYIGDDLNDLPVIRRAGFSGCPRDATSDVLREVKYVCRAPGGHGAVREFSDVIYAGSVRSLSTVTG